MRNIIPKLGLKFLRDAELTEYAYEKVEKINAAAGFAGIVPSAADVRAKTLQYDAALVKADNGTRADTAKKNALRTELEQMLMYQASDAARIASGDMALYLRSGYAAKNVKGSPGGELPEVRGVQLSYGNNTGELKIKWNTLLKAQNFIVQVYADNAHPEASLIKEYFFNKIGRKKTTLSDLPSGKIVFVRVRANGGSTGQGPWSDVTEKRVP
ncbi:MAG: hypothetical protein HY840_07280 [Bacteroidetes bacterium]|nr:hypothetical protein [Bacteroidota bacterium]